MKRRVFLLLGAFAGSLGWIAARSTTSHDPNAESEFSSGKPSASLQKDGPTSHARLPRWQRAEPLTPSGDANTGLVPERLSRDASARAGQIAPDHAQPQSALTTQAAGNLAARNPSDASVFDLTSSDQPDTRNWLPLAFADGRPAFVATPIETTFNGSRQTLTMTFTLVYDRADLDRSGTVDSEDLRELIDRIATGDPTADINSDGLADGGDVTEFLSRYPD